jgi:hypothetical protein
VRAIGRGRGRGEGKFDIHTKVSRLGGEVDLDDVGGGEDGLRVASVSSPVPLRCLSLQKRRGGARSARPSPAALAVPFAPPISSNASSTAPEPLIRAPEGELSETDLVRKGEGELQLGRDVGDLCVPAGEAGSGGEGAANSESEHGGREVEGRERWESGRSNEEDEGGTRHSCSSVRLRGHFSTLCCSTLPISAFPATLHALPNLPHLFPPSHLLLSPASTRTASSARQYSTDTWWTVSNLFQLDRTVPAS